MVSKVLDLLIAVTFVYAVESIYNIVTGNDGCHELQLNFICPRNWENVKELGKELWLYILPPIAMILHIAQVAHYHQKRSDWHVEEFIDKKIEGWLELLQIISYVIPVGALILATKFLPHDKYRTLIMFLWLLTFLAYLCGDLLTINKWKNPDTANKGYQNFYSLVKVAWIFDLVMFILGSCIFYDMNCENRKESWWDGVSIFSFCIFCYTIILYKYGKKFLLSTPQNNNPKQAKKRV